MDFYRLAGNVIGVVILLCATAVVAFGTIALIRLMIGAC